MLINGENYEVIKIYPDETNSLKDLIFCKNQHGFWSTNEKKTIRELLEQKMTPNQIAEHNLFDARTRDAVYMCAKSILREMEKRDAKN